MIAAIVQARMGSARLPGKVLEDICGKPMLQRVVERVRRAKLVDDVILATTTHAADDPLQNLAAALDLPVFRGSESDVLDRYYQAAKRFGIRTIVRVTADCPLIDPEIIDLAVAEFLDGRFDHVSTAYPKATFPDGLDVWVFSAEALERAWKEATLESEREHVTPYIWKNGDLFKLYNIQHSEDLSGMRWTVDEDGDLEFVREVYGRLGGKADEIFGMQDILGLIERHPEMSAINARIGRDGGYRKSLSNDRESAQH